MKNKQNLSALRAQIQDLSFAQMNHVKGGNGNSADATQISTAPVVLNIVFTTVANTTGALKTNSTNVQSDDKRRQRPGGGISTH